tara:strand:- start:207 stop:419 length:213 start_codon:yes stop_codon:yes gene_type:complete
MRALYYFYILLAVIGALLVFDRIWFTIIDMSLFIKLMISLGVVGGLTVTIQLIRDELIVDKNDKDDKFTN